MASRRDLLEHPNWGDWRWQLANGISSTEALDEWVTSSPEERDGIARGAEKFRWSLVPYYANLMDPEDPNCPVRRMAIPHADEFVLDPFATEDPVEDRSFLKTRRVIHKYSDRAIFLVSDSCPVYCRHCTRKFHTMDREGTYFGETRDRSLDADFDYIRATPQIRDVLLTGGDPLSISNRRLETILAGLRAIPNIEIVRVGSRFPVLLPMRIDDELCAMLAKHGPCFFSTHFNHPKEITPEAEAACRKLLRHGIPVLNQSVLLKGVNDDPVLLRRLYCDLLKIGVVPYYLYHCDNVAGVSHFMLSLRRGMEIFERLRASTTGFAVPRYVMATPIGKIPIDFDHVTLFGDGIEVRNFEGETLRIACPRLSRLLEVAS